MCDMHFGALLHGAERWDTSECSWMELRHISVWNWGWIQRAHTVHPPACLLTRTTSHYVSVMAVMWPSHLETPEPLVLAHGGCSESLVQEWSLQGKHLLREGWEGELKRGEKVFISKIYILVFLCSLFLLNSSSSLVFKGNLLRKCIVKSWCFSGCQGGGDKHHKLSMLFMDKSQLIFHIYHLCF